MLKGNIFHEKHHLFELITIELQLDWHICFRDGLYAKVVDGANIPPGKEVWSQMPFGRVHRKLVRRIRLGRPDGLPTHLHMYQIKPQALLYLPEQQTSHHWMTYFKSATRLPSSTLSDWVRPDGSLTKIYISIIIMIKHSLIFFL